VRVVLYIDLASNSNLFQEYISVSSFEKDRRERPRFSYTPEGRGWLLPASRPENLVLLRFPHFQ
jgi:hypothetical protein